MAIDTEGKRRSTVAVLPVSDGTIGTQDRPHVCWIYSGLVIAVAAWIYWGAVYANITPTADVEANITPTGDVDANITPTGDVEIAT